MRVRLAFGLAGLAAAVLIEVGFGTAVAEAARCASAAHRVSETPALFLGTTGSKLKPVSSMETFDAAKLAAAIRALG